MKAPIPENEAERIAVLKEYGLLDTPPESTFDDLVALAARICQAPVGLLTLVDTDRQWFKARFGLDIQETERDLSFCADTIMQDSVFVVPDARADSRFSENPMVTGPLGVRFYAGAPLRSPEGHALGALCIIDRVPRQLSPEHGEALTILVRHIEAAIGERRRARSAAGALAETEARLGMLAEAAPDAVVVIGEDSTIEFANDAVSRVFGYPAASLIGLSLTLLQPEREREGHRQGLRRYLETGERRLDWRATQTVGLHHDGREFPIEVAFTHFKHNGRHRFAAFIRDISARRAAEAALRESEGRYRTLVESSAVGIWHLDRKRRTAYINPAMLAMIEVDTVAGLRDRTFRDFLTRETRLVADREYARRAHGEASSYEVEMVGDRGGRRHVLVSGAPLHDSRGAWVGTIGTLVDVTELRKAERQLGYLTQFDALTGLPNRNLFADRLGQALARADRTGRMVALLLINVDRFKEINDSLGHHVGDGVLRAVAARLREALFDADTVARLGADEFALVVEGLRDRGEVGAVAQRLRDGFVSPVHVAGHEIFLQASMGIALSPDDSRDPTAMLRLADLALDSARKAGGGWRFGEAGAERRPSRRREIDAQLRRALERGEMAIEYEPMVESATRRVLGLEALLRWNSAGLGPLQPNEFIPFAEETGLIVPIGRWVFETACADLKRWQAEGHSGLFVSVNLSARQMREPDFTDMVKAGVAGLPPGAVELELTESMLIDSAGASRVALDEIRAAGVRISVDDFGTGYSSLAYLRSFPIDKLKVDRSFVRDIGLDPRVEAIVHTVIALARGLGPTSTAEGVEQPHQFEFLARAGCDQCQGFLFSRSVPASAVPALLRSGVSGPDLPV
jgi:diguanylate cyclase (GGDEF)-like protein/PAS domain S-box-containing protein